MHDLSAWTELLLFACGVSSVVGAVLLDSDNRAGTGFMLGLAGGPLGLVLAYRIHLFVAAGRALPDDGRYGGLICCYRPPPRAAAVLTGPALVSVFTIAFLLLQERFGFPLGVAAILLAILLMPDSKDLLVAAFDQGVLLGGRFIPWSALREIEYFSSEPQQGPAGMTEVWFFHHVRGRAGRPEMLRSPTAGYLNVSEFNAVLKTKSKLRVVTPESTE